jgi:hypothetical protein
MITNVLVVQVLIGWLAACAVTTVVVCGWCRAGHAEDVARGYEA